MKKTLIFLSLCLFSVFLFSCSVEVSVPENNETDWESLLEESQTEETQDNTAAEENAEEIPQTSQNTPIPEETKNNQEWRQFLKDYEEWVDDYVAFMKKYKANPTDLSLLSDYAKMSAKALEWSNKASDIQSDLSADDLNEYLQTLSRITTKLAEVAY